jgi:hypothetical protein
LIPVGIVRLAVSLSLAAFLASAGCSSSSGEDASSAGGDRDEEDDSGGGGAGPEGVECELAADCVPAGSTCCDCPAFAVPATSGYEEACSDVTCDPAPTGCSLTEPACSAGRCELVCAPIATEMVCLDGFVRDDFGCLLDACADPGTSTAECEGDEDCVQVPADCCGCELGGSDTAVPAGTEEEHEDELACPPDPSCPGVDVCDPDSEPRCIGGTCRLAGPPGEPGGDDAPSLLCGTADTPPCPDGQVCVLNHPDAGDATQLGAGSCQDL